MLHIEFPTVRLLRIRALCAMDASGSSGTQEVKWAAFAKEELFVSEDYVT